MLHKGDLVKVADTSREYHGKYVGFTGKVQLGYGQYGDQVAVHFTGMRNERSSYGYFWFHERNLSKVEDAEQEDNFMLNGYTVATARILKPNGQENNYALYDGSIVADDLVVVSIAGSYEIAKVTAVREESEEVKVQGQRQVVCKIDDSAYLERKCVEKEIKLLKAEMDKRVESLQAIALYELMAEKDPSLKELLDKFKTLNNGV